MINPIEQLEDIIIYESHDRLDRQKLQRLGETALASGVPLTYYDVLLSIRALIGSERSAQSIRDAASSLFIGGSSMTFDDYQQAVAHRFKSDFSTVDALMVAVSGILIELDEVGRATTSANEHEELGDVLFYIAYSADALGIAGLSYRFHNVDLLDVYSELLQALGDIHKENRGVDPKRNYVPQAAYAISMAYRWIEQQGVAMESLYQANIKKVSGL